MSPNRDTGATGPLEFVQVPGPVVFQQARERAVGEDLAAGLAAGAVVRLAVGVADALDRGRAVRAGLAEAAVDGHVGAEGRDALGEAVARLGAEAVDPFAEDFSRGCVEDFDLLAATASGS